MAMTTMIVLFASLVCTGEAGFEPEWFAGVKKGAKDDMKKDLDEEAEIVHVGEVLELSPFSGESCSEADHAMTVHEIALDKQSFRVKVKGHLHRKVANGTVTMRLDLGKAPADLKAGERFKRKMAWVLSGKHKDEENICTHFARTMWGYQQATCPFEEGPQEFHFGFNRLPSTVLTGKYHMEIRVEDDAGPVLCVKGELEVPQGRRNQIFRKLQMATTTTALQRTSTWYRTSTTRTWIYSTTKYGTTSGRWWTTSYNPYYTTRPPVMVSAAGYQSAVTFVLVAISTVWSFACPYGGTSSMP
jgi:hypothetical protein